MDKLENLILYIANQCEDDERFSATKLNKLLFVIDFNAYALQGRPVTGASYIHLQYGPVPKEFVAARNELLRSGRAEIVTRLYFGREQQRLKARVSPNLDLFSKDELSLIDDMIARHATVTGTQMSEASHAFRNWQQTRMYEDIPYETVYVIEEVPVTLDDIEWGVKRVGRTRAYIINVTASVIVRSIIEEPSFSESYDELLVIFPRLDDVKAGVDWLLSRDPYSGTPIPMRNYLVLNTLPIGGVPSFTILYRYDPEPGIEDDDNSVYLVDIRPRIPAEAER